MFNRYDGVRVIDSCIAAAWTDFSQCHENQRTTEFCPGSSATRFVTRNCAFGHASCWSCVSITEGRRPRRWHRLHGICLRS